MAYDDATEGTDGDRDPTDAAHDGDEATVHADALAAFDEICFAQQEERALGLADRRFVSIAGAQWEGQWGEQFENSIMVEVNKTAQGCERITTDYRKNRITVNFRAVAKGASEETAEVMNGMFRADAYASKAQQVFDNAFEEGIQGGWGAWRLLNKREDETDPDDERQRIFFDIIPDADQSVFFDMDARLYDKSDARFCFVVTAMSPAAFARKFGKDRDSDWPDSILKPYYDWYTPDVVRVAEYYCVEERKEWRLTLVHRATGEERREWNKDLEAGELDELLTEGWRLAKRRKVTRRRVAKWVMSGSEILKPKVYIAGDQIPVIPFYGKRWFIDNMERVRGHVRLAKDPQRIYNAQTTKLVETAALSPIERPIFTPEQVAGHADSWATANIDRAPYALINSIIGADGNPMPAGPIGMLTPPQIAPAVVGLMQISGADIAELTNSQDTAEEVRSNVSAEAMDIAATRQDSKAFPYMDNMRQSMQRCGEVYLSMARDVYVEEDREVETMDEEGGYGVATLYEPYTDEKGSFSIRNDIARGSYKVISDVTEATTTRRDKTVKTLVSVAQIAATTDPELAAAALSTAMINMDGEGMADLQDWMRGRLVRQGVVKPTEEEKASMQEEAQGAQPDPQALALQAVAEKESALAGKAVADTALSEAKVGLTEAQTVETLAKASGAGVQADHTRVLTDRERQTPIAQPKPSALERVSNG